MFIPYKAFKNILFSALSFLLSMSLDAAVFTPTTVPQLIADITNANTNNQNDTIDLGGNTFILTAVDNINDGNNGLPSILADFGRTLSIINGTIERSAVAPAFRILHIGGGADLSLDNVIIRRGYAAAGAGNPNSGGAIFNTSRLTLENSTLNLNVAEDNGGAIFNTTINGLIISINNSVLSSNTAQDSGGGIYNAASITSINNTTIQANVANSGNPGGGGGIINLGFITGITNSTISGNFANFGNGAGILNFANIITTLSNTTISGNTTGNRGGGIQNTGNITNLSNNTIVNNRSISSSGGGIDNNGGTISNFRSTIVANNIAVISPDIFSNVNISAESFNLIRNNTGSSFIAGTPNANSSFVGTAVSPINPMLGSLQNNGGLTRTHALITGSIAIDNGANPYNFFFDQRGSPFARVVNGQADIGAFETQACIDVDSDGDGVCDSNDNCPGNANSSQVDTDADSIGDSCDNCALLANPDQDDSDNDDIGDVCDTCTDFDDDGIGDESFPANTCAANANDNCPFTVNPSQVDTDNDGLGNACDECLLGDASADVDADGVCDSADICPGFNDAVDPDADGHATGCDNCELIANPDQADFDGDGIGNACDTCTDIDDDGIGDESFAANSCSANADDNCPFAANPLQTDSDGDGIGNACDECPLDDLNADADLDGICDAIDRCPGFDDAVDPDNDGHPTGCDNCPLVANNNQQDTDHDGIGDLCDNCTDVDADGVGNAGFDTSGCLYNTLVDNCPFEVNPPIAPALTQLDTDGDGTGNACDVCPADAGVDNDSDADGICNASDRCPEANDASDSDFDTIPNACDNCPNDENTDQLDSDHDGIGDVCDLCLDQDGDGLCNEEDPCPLDASNFCADSDEDGIPDSLDNCINVDNPLQIDTDNDGVGDTCDTCTDSDRDGFGDQGFDISSCAGSTSLSDNCTFSPNAEQVDTDADGIGNACDTCAGGDSENDEDSDGTCDAADLCPNADDAADEDFDGRADGCDNCPLIANNFQLDTDQDGIGDACDDCTDQDDDSICDEEDNCPFDANTDQEDGDADGLGNACDKLIDLELIRPVPPPLPILPAPPIVDPALNGAVSPIAEAPAEIIFNDSDQDGLVDEEDNCPSVVNKNQSDEDNDGIGDACEPQSSFVDKKAINKKAPAQEGSGCSQMGGLAQSANNLWLMFILGLGAFRSFYGARLIRKK